MIKKNHLILFLILLFTFIFYSSSLSFFFISDDFFHISFNTIREIISYNPYYNHYIPAFLGVLWIIKKIFGTNPFYFHLYVISLHLVNIFLVSIFVKNYLNSTRKSLLVALCFSILFSQYESLFWITGTTTSLMTAFFMLSLIFFQLFTKSNNKKYVILSAIAACISLLSHEHAVIIFPTITALAIFRKVKLNILKPYFVPFSIFIYISLLKIFSVHSELIKIPNFVRFIQSVVKSNLYLLLPFPNLIDIIPKGFSPVIFFLIFLLVLMLISKNVKLGIFFLILEMHILLFSLTSLPQARYLYFSSIPSLILIIFFISLYRKLLQFLIIFMLIYFSMSFLFQRSKEWKVNSMITRNVVIDLGNIFRKFPSDKPVYFINLPDSTNGPPWNAYLFRNGIERIVEYMYGTLPDNLNYASTEKNNILLRNDPYISAKNIENLNNQNNFVILNYKSGKLYLSEGKIVEEK